MSRTNQYKLNIATGNYAYNFKHYRIGYSSYFMKALLFTHVIPSMFSIGSFREKVNKNYTHNKALIRLSACKFILAILYLFMCFLFTSIYVLTIYCNQPVSNHIKNILFQLILLLLFSALLQGIEPFLRLFTNKHLFIKQPYDNSSISKLRQNFIYKDNILSGIVIINTNQIARYNFNLVKDYTCVIYTHNYVYITSTGYYKPITLTKNQYNLNPGGLIIPYENMTPELNKLITEITNYKHTLTFNFGIRK